MNLSMHCAAPTACILSAVKVQPRLHRPLGSSCCSAPCSRAVVTVCRQPQSSGRTSSATTWMPRATQQSRCCRALSAALLTLCGRGPISRLAPAMTCRTAAFPDCWGALHQVVERLKGALQGKGVQAKVIHSGGSDVDILAAGASKGDGLKFLLKQVRLGPTAAAAHACAAPNGLLRCQSAGRIWGCCSRLLRLCRLASC